MSRHAALDRLRDISKQRVNRRPLLVPLPIPGVDESGEARKTKIEWPVPD